MQTVGFVGLGLMGTSMTRNLIERGFVVRGFDVDEVRRRELDARGGESVDTLEAAVRDVDVLFLSLPNGDIVRNVCFGEGGVAEAAAPGLVVVDTTTSRPGDTIRTGEELASVGITFLDAAVSGTSKMAASRDLIAMVGGPGEAYEYISPALEAITRARYHLGPVGSGVKTKLVVNLALGVSRLMLAEALVLGERSGMDLETLLDVLKDSVASSRVMEIYGDRMVRGEHLPPTGRIRSHSKDIGLILEFGREQGVPLWLTPVLDQILQFARLSGMSEWDSTSTMEVLRRLTDEGRVAASTLPSGSSS